MSADQLETAIWAVIGKIAFWYVAAAVVIGLLNSYLAKHTDIGRDDTDPPNGRSDMQVLTDHRTGCQYLVSAKGGLAPRLDGSGKHICEKKEGAV